MNVNRWINFLLSVILSTVDWLQSTTLLSIPLLYILLAISIMGVIIRALIYRA